METYGESANEIQQYFDEYHKVIFKNSQNVVNVALVESKIQEELNEGSTRLRTAPCYRQTQLNELSRQIKQKNDKFNKDLFLLNMSVSQQNSSCRSKFSKSMNRRKTSTRSLRKTNQSVSFEEFKDYKKGQMMRNMRIKQLQKMQESLKLSKLERQKRDKKRDEQLQMSRKQEQDIQKRRKQVQKLNKINERLQRLQESKKCRLMNLKRKVGKSLPILPKYKIMRERFDLQQIKFEQQQKRRIMKIKIEKQKQYDLRNIKQHTLKYDSVLKQKSRIRTQGNSPQKELSVSRVIENEKNYNKIGPNPQKVAECKRKIERVNEYDNMNVSRRLNMRVDPMIGKQFEALKDKSKFPFKYHYLKIKKNLSDLEIYENYNFFNFDSDPIQIGNVYLAQLKNINENQKRNKVMKSENKIKTQGSSYKINNNNYLHDMKMNRRSIMSSNVEELVQASGRKQKLMKILFQQEKYGFQKRISNKSSLVKPASYSNAMRTQLLADQNIIDSMKSKLKGLKLE